MHSGTVSLVVLGSIQIPESNIYWKAPYTGKHIQLPKSIEKYLQGGVYGLEIIILCALAIDHDAHRLCF